MLELVNRTPFAAGLFPMWDRDAHEVALLVVKCTFTVADGQTFPAVQQALLCLSDEYYGAPDKTSVRVGNDLALFKPAVDVVVVGSAYAPSGTSVRKLKVTLLIGSAVRALRVTGERTWVGGILGYHPSDPAPFTRLSLTYERSYGGTDQKSADMRNPVGRGYHERESGIEGSLLPNVEWDDAPLESWQGRSEPAGLGFVAPSWHPRSQYGGTYGESWLESRMPFLPDDFDYRHFQAASPRLTFSSLQPGDPIVLESMTPEGPFSFKLPDARLSAVYRHDRAGGEIGLQRDTVVIEPDEKRVILIYRALIPCHQHHLGLRQVLVGDLTSGMKRAFLTGKKYWDVKTSMTARTRT